MRGAHAIGGGAPKLLTAFKQASAAHRQTAKATSKVDGQPCQAYRRAPDATPKAYHNPADVELTVELPDNVKGHVRFFNNQGRQVRQVPARGKQVVLDVRALPEGLYQLHIPMASGVSQQQIQIKH